MKFGVAARRDIGPSFLAGDAHPDHDAIRRFRRRNRESFQKAFVEMPPPAEEMGFLKAGAASVDGAKMRANASKRRGVRHDRALELREESRAEVKELLDKAEEADRADEPDDRKPPDGLRRAEKLKGESGKAIRRLGRLKFSPVGGNRAMDRPATPDFIPSAAIR